MTDMIDILRGKDHPKAHALLKELAAASARSDAYYASFDAFAALMSAKSSYVRTRGFLLCCAQVRWDADGKLARAFPAMCALLHDEKPTVVRQCLQALHEVALYQPALCGAVSRELDTIDVQQYRDSMAPLIQKDIDELRSLMAQHF